MSMSARERFLRHVGAALSVLAALGQPAPSIAAERLPIAAVTIYPGDIIREQMLTDGDFPDAISGSPYATNLTMLIGKMAKRTLLPGKPIPANAVGEPRLVTIGARVRLVFEEGGLQISTYASALQAGAAGDVVSVRNMESGITLSGTIFPDGSVRVGPGAGSS